MGTSTSEVGSDTNVELVEEGNTIVDKTVLDVITATVDVCSGIKVVDGDGVSQILYSQSIVYEPSSRTRACETSLTIKGTAETQQLTLIISCSSKGPSINATSTPLEDDLL